MSTVSAQTELWAERARDHGAEAAAQASSEWTRKAETWVLALSSGATFTIDDVRFVLGAPESDNACGSLCLNLSKSGAIRAVGYVRSTRIRRHAARVCVWERT